MPRKRCAFCLRDDRKITKEHAWPDWIHKWLPAPGAAISFQRGDQPTDSWSVAPTDMGVKVNDVCKTCNEIWMSGLEGAVIPTLSPMIKGLERAHIDPQQQRQVAIWAYKTAMVFDLLNRPNARHFSDAERHALQQTLDVPTHQPFIWLAAFNGFQVATAVDHRVFYDAGNDAPERPTDTYCLTITVGHVALQVFAYHRLEESQPFSIRVPAVWDSATARLWPQPTAVKSIEWPPAEVFDGHGLSLFIDRFRPRQT